MSISRRELLKLAGRALSAMSATGGLLHWSRLSARAQTVSDYRALVCIFMNGGNDGNNTIVPFATGEYAAYASGRAGLSLPQSSLRPIATTAGEQFGLHPQLPRLQALFQQRRAAIVANVGMLTQPITRAGYLSQTAALPTNLYSHIDQQLQWQSALSDGSGVTGWAGRAADRLAAANLPAGYPVVVSTAGNALFGVGTQGVAASVIPGSAPGLAGVDSSTIATERVEALEELLFLDSGSVLIQSANSTFREGLRQSRLLQSALANRPGLTTPFPATPLGRQLLEVAKIIQVRNELGVKRQIFFCTMDGFDHHSGLLEGHTKLLAELDQGVFALHSATVELGVENAVTTFTQSEFGRTLQPSSGSGTDHAWGSHHFVIGGAVRGGQMFGQFPTMALGGPDDAGDRGVWIPTSSLDQYGATLASWLGVPDNELVTVFPRLANFATADLGFMA